MTERAAFLASLTAAEVRAEADALSKQAARLRRMADAMDGAETAVSRRTRTTTGRKAATTPSKRPAILAAMQTRPEASWSPKEVFDALVQRGDMPGDGNPENIRVAIHRMARAGELRKVDSGAYTLPAPTAPNGAAPAMFTEDGP